MKPSGAVEADGVDADGIGAEEVVADDGGGERLADGAVAAFAAGLAPLAGVDVCPAGEGSGSERGRRRRG
jgi:hypothetical protein